MPTVAVLHPEFEHLLNARTKLQDRVFRALAELGVRTGELAGFTADEATELLRAFIMGWFFERHLKGAERDQDIASVVRAFRRARAARGRTTPRHLVGPAPPRSARLAPRLDGPTRRHHLTTIARSGWDPLCELLGDALTPAERALGDELPQRVDDVLVRMGQPPSTLIHSDLRADNLLFAPNGTSVTIVDWQGAGIGPPAWDLAYFLSQSLHVDTRRANERQLLDHYVADAQRIRPQLEISGLLAGYGECMLFGLIVATSLPIISDPGQPRVRAPAETMARRAIEALRDHGQLWGPAATRQERT